MVEIIFKEDRSSYARLSDAGSWTWVQVPAVVREHVEEVFDAHRDDRSPSDGDAEYDVVEHFKRAGFEAFYVPTPVEDGAVF